MKHSTQSCCPAVTTSVVIRLFVIALHWVSVTLRQQKIGTVVNGDGQIAFENELMNRSKRLLFVICCSLFDCFLTYNRAHAHFAPIDANFSYI